MVPHLTTEALASTEPPSAVVVRRSRSTPSTRRTRVSGLVSSGFTKSLFFEKDADVMKFSWAENSALPHPSRVAPAKLPVQQVVGAASTLAVTAVTVGAVRRNRSAVLPGEGSTLVEAVLGVATGAAAGPSRAVADWSWPEASQEGLQMEPHRSSSRLAARFSDALTPYSSGPSSSR